ncbi:MAG: hypothetical protein DRJ34_01950 [Thermoprotei archaeon]|nr:MAG: hypothetical protein DRJ34_01950 [Thermoprotei archaeon]
MKCELCGKREATVLYALKKGKTVLFHLKLCPECARKGLKDKVIDGLNKFLELLLPVKEEKKCPDCGLSKEEFKKTGFLGCPRCYSTFRKEIEGLVKKIQFAPYHKGRLPTRLEKLREERILKKLLQDAIEEERFEDAGKLKEKLDKLLSPPHVGKES